MKKTLILSSIVIFFFSSCLKEETLQEKAIKAIETSYKDFQPEMLEYSPIDSVYTTIIETDAYRENQLDLMDTYDKWRKEKSDHDYEKARFGTEITKGLILLYQKRIRECLERENELKSKFTPRFKECVIQQLYCIHTDFGDSIRINAYSLNDDVTKATLIDRGSIPMELYNLIKQNGTFFSDNMARADSITKQFYHYDFSEIKKSFTIDTTDFIR